MTDQVINYSLKFIELIVGAILGYIFASIVPDVFKKIRKKRILKRKRRNKELLKSGKVHRWAISYYEKNGNLDDLYMCRIGKVEKIIPFITCDKWTNISSLEEINFTFNISYEIRDFQVDEKMINEKKEAGEVVFDDPSIYLISVEDSASGIVIKLGQCRYYEIVSSMNSLESETFRHTKKNKFENASNRSKYFRSMTCSAKEKDRPFSVGVVCLLHATINGIPCFLMQTRSNETATNPGFVSGVPSYGLSPQPNTKDGLSMMKYNLIKEYLEEIFNRDDLIREYLKKNTSSDWLYSEPEAVDLLEALAEGKVEINFLGFGFDTLNGTATFAIEIRIHEINAVPSLKSISGNWETSEYTIETRLPGLQWIPSDSDDIGNLLHEGKLHLGTSFALSQALLKKQEHYNEQRNHHG